jgi:hypothetical protein
MVNYDPDLRVHKRRPKMSREGYCSIEGCYSLIKGQRLCAKHYRRFTTHGDPNQGPTKLYLSSEYVAWAGMKQRCLNPKNKGYKKWYGALGVKVCERWLRFENFLADMGPRPTPRHEIDRYPDPNGNYEPTNCRWATRKENMRNLRTNRLVTIDGVTRCLVEWMEISPVKKRTIKGRLHAGWNERDAILTPTNQRRAQ